VGPITLKSTMNILGRNVG